MYVRRLTLAIWHHCKNYHSD